VCHGARSVMKMSVRAGTLKSIHAPVDTKPSETDVPSLETPVSGDSREEAIAAGDEMFFADRGRFFS